MADSFWMIFLTTYALIKDVISLKVSSKLPPGFLKVISIAFSVLFLTIISIFLTPFLIFRAFLYVTLKLIYGENFGGFLIAIDLLFEVNKEPSLISISAIYSLNTKEKAAHKELARKIVEEVHESSYKLNSIVKKFCGYCYYVKNRTRVEDVLEFIDDDDANYITRNTIFDYIQESCQTLRTGQTWKAAVFLQPVKWNDDNKIVQGNQYVIVITIRHCVGDGPSILGALKRLLTKEEEETQRKRAELRFGRPKMTLDNVYVHRNPLYQKMKSDTLKIEGNSEWHVAAYIDSECKYIPIIKSIKKKLDVSFVDVINAAISSSVLDYIVKRKVAMDTVTASTILRLHTNDLSKIINRTYDFKDMDNTFTFVGYQIPFEATEPSMRKKILALSKISETLAGSVDFFVPHGIMRYICTYIPTILTKPIIRATVEGLPLATTNLIGCVKSTCYGTPIDDIFFCVPTCLQIGFVFSIFSYDERLAVAAVSRRGYVYNREELQGFVGYTEFHCGRFATTDISSPITYDYITNSQYAHSIIGSGKSTTAKHPISVSVMLRTIVYLSMSVIVSKRLILGDYQNKLT